MSLMADASKAESARYGARHSITYPSVINFTTKNALVTLADNRRGARIPFHLAGHCFIITTVLFRGKLYATCDERT